MSDPLPSLPHHLRPGIRIVFIGYNPGLESARQGHYYAFHGNVFWRQLSASGLVSRQVTHLDDATLLDEADIGFTDLCCRPTARASELTPAEITEGANRLRNELLENQPAYAVFSGRGIYQHFGRLVLGLTTKDLAARPNGPQPERIGATIPYVIPSSSGLASKWHAERLALLRGLSTLLGNPVDP